MSEVDTRDIEQLLEDAVLQVEQVSGEKPKHIRVLPADWRALADKLLAQGRLYPGQGAAARDAFMGIPVICDPRVPEGTVYLLDTTPEEWDEYMGERSA